MMSFIVAAAVYSAPVPAMNYDWFSPVYDSPKNGLKPNELAIVSVDITVNPYGYIQDCIGHVRSGNPSLGPYVCSRLRLRGEFDEARDPNKHRMYGIYRTSVVFWTGDFKNLPKYSISNFDIVNAVGAPQPEHDSFVMQFAADAQGRPSSCSLVPMLGYGLNRRKQQAVDERLIAQACAELPAKMHIEPARDRAGRPVASVQTASVGVTTKE